MISRSVLAARLSIVAVLAATAVIWVASAPASASVYGSAAANRAAARAAATRLLSELHLPAGARRSRGKPGLVLSPLSTVI